MIANDLLVKQGDDDSNQHTNGRNKVTFFRGIWMAK